MLPLFVYAFGGYREHPAGNNQQPKRMVVVADESHGHG